MSDQIRLPYPLRNADELAGCLISHGLLNEYAWFDPEGWDGGIQHDRVHGMLDQIKKELESNMGIKCPKVVTTTEKQQAQAHSKR